MTDDMITANRQALIDGKVLSGIGMHREKKFGGVALEYALADFHEAGFCYGDSVDVFFSNGEELIDIPYYDNYYSPFDTPMMCGFPSFAQPRIGYNMTRDAWYVHHLSESDTLTVRLNRPGGYMETQTMLAMRTSNDLAEHESPQAFANFRCVESSGMKPGVLYRYASACDLEHARNEWADKFMGEAGIRFAINLANSMEEMDELVLDEEVKSPNFKRLHLAHCIAPANIGVNYREPRSKAGIAAAMKELIKHDGPYLVWCSLGKDRTGFICLLLQALCGANYEEIKTEYMKTFRNLYNFDESSNPEKYHAVEDMYLKDMLVIITDSDSKEGIESKDYAAGARKYLESCGMTPEEIDTLKAKLARY